MATPAGSSAPAVAPTETAPVVSPTDTNAPAATPPATEAPAMTEPATGAERPATYTVVSGDTLWDISRKFDTSIKKLKALNHLKKNNLKPGQVLRDSAGEGHSDGEEDDEREGEVEEEGGHDPRSSCEAALRGFAGIEPGLFLEREGARLSHAFGTVAGASEGGADEHDDGDDGTAAHDGIAADRTFAGWSGRDGEAGDHFPHAEQVSAGFERADPDPGDDPIGGFIHAGDEAGRITASLIFSTHRRHRSIGARGLRRWHASWATGA